jgi:type II secretory pathway component PulC
MEKENIKFGFLKKIIYMFYKLSIIILIGYIFSKIVYSLIVGQLIDMTVAKKTSKKNYKYKKELIENNFKNHKKDILTRNIFNSEGEFPDENVKSIKKEEKIAKNKKCIESTIKNISLNGVVVSESRSAALITEKGWPPDVYLKGKTLLGFENVIVEEINPHMVILNNNNQRECLRLPLKPKPKTFIAKEQKESKLNSAINVNIPLSVMEEKSKRLDDLNFILSPVENGFRLSNFQSDSILAKIFKNRDIITKVITKTEEKSLNLDSGNTGYDLISALKNENWIKLNIIRNGQPYDITVNVDQKE